MRIGRTSLIPGEASFVALGRSWGPVFGPGSVVGVDRCLEQWVGLASEVALDATDRLELRFPLGGLAGGERLRVRVGAQPADGDHVQRPVGLTVTATVEAVPISLAG